MINEKAIKGQAEFARKLNAGEFDHLPQFTTGQVDKNGGGRTWMPDAQADSLLDARDELKRVRARAQRLADALDAMAQVGIWGKSSPTLAKARAALAQWEERAK